MSPHPRETGDDRLEGDGDSKGQMTQYTVARATVVAWVNMGNYLIYF